MKMITCKCGCSKKLENAYLRNFSSIAVSVLLLTLLSQIPFLISSLPPKAYILIDNLPGMLQILAVPFIGFYLGSKRACLTILIYFCAVIIGIPVLNYADSGPLIMLASGYFPGYLLSAYVSGFLAENGKNDTTGKTLVNLVICNVSILIPGVIWLALTPIGPVGALVVGLIQFLIVGGIQICIVMFLKKWQHRSVVQASVSI